MVRRVLVTGAAGGIGGALVERLRADGLEVVGTDLHGSDVDADLTTAEGNAAAVAAARERLGGLDAIVANAGMQHVAPVRDFPPEAWDRLLALMLSSPFHLARAAWDDLRRFVVIASAHGLVASPYKSAYVAAKHGVVGLVKVLALEGLQATALCPGYVRTPLVERQLAEQARAHGLPEAQVLEEVILAPHAVKRLIEPEEVAGAVAFLLGEGGAAFSGAALPMDLGWTAR